MNGVLARRASEAFPRWRVGLTSHMSGKEADS